VNVILSALVPLSFRICGRASLKLGLVAPRHQVVPLRRHRTHPPFLLIERLFWVCTLPSAVSRGSARNGSVKAGGESRNDKPGGLRNVDRTTRHRTPP
jgi:hypothetical protein